MSDEKTEPLDTDTMARPISNEPELMARAAEAEQVYVVQIGTFEGDAPLTWEDIATVKVPPRTKRSTVIKQALSDAGIRPAKDGDKPRLRALDVDSAEIHEPEAVQPPPEWRL